MRFDVEVGRPAPLLDTNALEDSFSLNFTSSNSLFSVSASANSFRAADLSFPSSSFSPFSTSLSFSLSFWLLISARMLEPLDAAPKVRLLLKNSGDSVSLSLLRCFLKAWDTLSADDPDGVS